MACSRAALLRGTLTYQTAAGPPENIRAGSFFNRCRGFAMGRLRAQTNARVGGRFEPAANIRMATRPPIRTALRNALRLRCPNCRRGRLFRGWPNRMFRSCPNCGLNYFPESGFYLGGMIITYVLSAFLLLVSYLFSLVLPVSAGLSENAKSTVWILVGVALCFALVRPSYSLWLALNFWIHPWTPSAPTPSGSPSAL